MRAFSKRLGDLLLWTPIIYGSTRITRMTSAPLATRRYSSPLHGRARRLTGLPSASSCLISMASRHWRSLLTSGRPISPHRSAVLTAPAPADQRSPPSPLHPSTHTPHFTNHHPNN